MQNDEETLEVLGGKYEGYMEQNYLDDGDYISFFYKVIAWKCFRSLHAYNGVSDQGLFTHLNRSGGFSHLSDYNGLRRAVTEEGIAKHRQPLLPNAALHRALVEAQTGFFGITEEEFEALKIPSTNAKECGIPLTSRDDNYATIFEDRPVSALAKISRDEFWEIRNEALRQEGLILDEELALRPYVPRPLPPLNTVTQPQWFVMSQADIDRVIAEEKAARSKGRGA